MCSLTGAIDIKTQKKVILFRNLKDEIILEVFKNKHLQAYGKEHWRLNG